MSRRCRRRSSSSRDVLLGLHPRLERVYVQLDVMGQRMPGRQVLGLQQRGAAGAVELNDPAPLGVRCEAVLALHDGRMDLARVAVGDQAALLVTLACVSE